MDWRDVRILYVMELRSAMRERAIVVNSVLLPIFLYPMEGFTSRVVVVGSAAGHPALLDSLGAMEEVEHRPRDRIPWEPAWSRPTPMV